MLFEAMIMGKFHGLEPVLCVGSVGSHMDVWRLAISELQN